MFDVQYADELFADVRVAEAKVREMKVVIMLIAVVFISQLLACDELARVQDESAPVATPMLPAIPEQPREAEESGAKPSTPKPASTPAPANAPLSVVTPFAVLPSYTPQPTATRSPASTATPISPEEFRAKTAENIQRCKHWAMQNLEPIEFSRFDRLNPKTMSDLDRILWGNMVSNPYGRYSLFEPREGETEWCMDYWSEPLTEQNAHKRNDQFRDECIYGIVRRARNYEQKIKEWAEIASEKYDVDVSPVIVNQHIRVMNWMDIDGADLLQIQESPAALVRRIYESRDEGYYGRYQGTENFPSKDTPSEVLEWWGIEDAFFYVIDPDTNECGLYYPQLFFGRWIPIDDYGTEDEAQQYKESIEDLRTEDEWPDWADGPARDILIQLE